MNPFNLGAELLHSSLAASSICLTPNEQDESESDDANREMGLPEGEDWGDK